MPKDKPLDDLHSRMIERQDALLQARKQVYEQLVGIDNQLHLIDQLLNPPPKPPSDPNNTM